MHTTPFILIHHYSNLASYNSCVFSLFRLRLYIPFTSITASPAVATVNHVNIEVEYDPDASESPPLSSLSSKNSDGGDRSQIENKESPMLSSSSTPSTSSTSPSTGSQGSSWYDDLIYRVMVNTTVHLNDVTITYTEKGVCSAALHIHAFTSHMTSSPAHQAGHHPASSSSSTSSFSKPDWKPGFHDPHGPWKLVHREALVTGLAIYVRPHTPPPPPPPPSHQQQQQQQQPPPSLGGGLGSRQSRSSSLNRSASSAEYIFQHTLTNSSPFPPYTCEAPFTVLAPLSFRIRAKAYLSCLQGLGKPGHCGSAQCPWQDFRYVY